MAHECWILSASKENEITFKISELNVTVQISAPFHLTTRKSNFDIIFRRDSIQELRIQLDFPKKFIRWQDINIPMRPIDCEMRNYFTIQDSNNVRNTDKRI